MNNAFVGVSLDSRSFSRDWLRAALPFLAKTHEHVLLLLADELFVYTRAQTADGGTAVDLSGAARSADSLCGEKERLFARELKKLHPSDSQRFRLLRWNAFSDAVYATIWRRLWLAYSVVDDFRNHVDEAARVHTVKVVQGSRTPNHAKVSAAYILDEIAMCLRVTEVEGYSYEYHPTTDLPVMQSLYEGAFAGEGVSVAALTGREPTRRFFVLTDGASEGSAAPLLVGHSSALSAD